MAFLDNGAELRATVESVPKDVAYLCHPDGSAKAGPGTPGGWGDCILPPDGPRLEGYGKASGTLAKIMEYRAVAKALR